MAQSKNQYTEFKFDSFDGVREEWLYWFERLKIAFRNTSIKNEEKKRDLLLGYLGPQPFKLVFDHARPTPVSNLSFNDIVDILNKYYKTPTAPLSQRVIFTRRLRQEGESVNQFELALRTLAGQCEFNDSLNERLRDQFILGINNDKWQLELLRLHASTKTTLTNVLESALLLENIDTQQSHLHDPRQLNKITNAEEYTIHRSTQQKSTRGTVLSLNKTTHCLRCGYRKHGPDRKCPALGAECRACGGNNHFSRACIKVGNATLNKKKQLNNIQGELMSSRSSVTSASDIDEIRALNKGSKVMIPVYLNGNYISMLYDPGAAFSIIGEKIWKQIGAPKLTMTENLTAYTGVTVETCGKTKISVKAFGTCQRLEVIVVKKEDIPLFGLDWVLKFNLPLPPGAKLCTMKASECTTTIDHDTKKSDSNLMKPILNEFADVFNTSLGSIKNCKVLFHMSPEAIPVVSKPRPVPLALRTAVEDELDRLVNNGVLQAINTREEPVTWASPIVVVVKPSGAIRLCADFKNTINKHMLADKYPMPRFEEITSKLTGGKEFTVIDLKDAYLQMEVDKSVQEYLVISTHKGFFKYTRLPFGIKIATGVFQCKMDQVLSGLEGVACFLDDIIITAPTREKHVERVKEVLKRFSEAGLRVQLSKCSWFQTSVTYLGHKINKDGIHPTEDHLIAIKNMPSPRNVKELRSFLGSINYYSKFVPHLQTLCVPLHKLLKNGEKWTWTDKHEKTASTLKSMLSTSDTLAHYDASLPLILATDASDVGLGAALFHRFSDGTEKPIAFVSRKLDSTESRYSTIEKEGLGLIFGVTRFEQYLYGRHFEIRTDHKALVRLFGEHDQIPKVVSNRIARWALTLSAYDYSITYRKGKDNTTADFLSRFPIESKIRSRDERLGNCNKAHLFHLRAQELPITIKSLREATKHDSTISQVINYIKNVWPSDEKVNTELRPYYGKRDELSYEHGVLLWMGRLIIPTKLRSNVMNILHEGHPGIAGMKGKARFQVWWPKLETDIEEFVKSCTGCQENRSKDASVPLFSWTVPSEVWSRIHIDFAGPFLGKMWLVVVDARSKWLEVIPTNGTTTKHTITILEDLFSRKGYPRIIVSDNGPQLTSFEFQTFCKNLNIKHARITPYHPKSNGLAERCVRTFKTQMKATSGDRNSLQEKLNMFLFSYRTSPKRSTGRTPAFIMFGRELNSKLDLLRPSVDVNFDQELIKQRINKTDGNEKVFKEQDHVWVLNTSGTGYTIGQVIKVNGPYSYLVNVKGIERRCHADQLRAAHNTSTSSDTF